MFGNLDMSQQNAIISAAGALLGSIIGAISTLAAIWIERKIQKSGKVVLYARLVYSKGIINEPWGYYRSSDRQGLFMHIPIWLDVCNTCGVTRVIRNINLYAYANKKEIAAFTQIQRREKGDMVISLGDNESYTLVIPDNSARRFNMEFVLYEKDLLSGETQFDELILTYFDEKNKIHAFLFSKVEKCWIEGPLEIKKEWFILNKSCKYAK